VTKRWAGHVACRRIFFSGENEDLDINGSIILKRILYIHMGGFELG